MNIYDFDNTIFKGDSSIKFIKYSLLRHPFIVIPSMFKSLWECIKYDASCKSKLCIKHYRMYCKYYYRYCTY